MEIIAISVMPCADIIKWLTSLYSVFWKSFGDQLIFNFSDMKKAHYSP